MLSSSNIVRKLHKFLMSKGKYSSNVFSRGDLSNWGSSIEDALTMAKTHGLYSSASLHLIKTVLELGIIVHSVIIGIALGANNAPKTIRPLLGALTFHQFFEGIGLGGCITQAKFKGRAAITLMAVFFSLTQLRLELMLESELKSVYNENGSIALIVQGVFNAAAGILIYMALVDLLSADFMNPKLQNSKMLRNGCFASLLIGAGLVSLLAKWA